MSGEQARSAQIPSALIPSTARSLPLAVSAKGARIFDEVGLDYIDASSGPLAVTLGHGHPRVLAAIAEQFAPTRLAAVLLGDASIITSPVAAIRPLASD